ncbi:MAG: hypothetical protein ACOY0T_25700 [Myxococcota bacterium]
MSRTLGALIVLGTTAVACGGGLPKPNDQHLTVARQSEPAVSLADLDRGRTLYASKCGKCHALREPGSLQPADWRHEIEEMETKQGVRLSNGESQDIYRYLAAVSMASRH